MTARDQMFAAIGDLLALDAGDGPVELMPSGDPDGYPLRRIFDDGQDPDNSEAGFTRYALAVSVEGHVEVAALDDDSATQRAAHAELNAMHARAVRRMMAEPPIGGLAETVEERGLRVADPTLANAGRLRFAQEFVITFVTPRGDPFTLL